MAENSSISNIEKLHALKILDWVTRICVVGDLPLEELAGATGNALGPFLDYDDS
jgi:hypothetical protein